VYYENSKVQYDALNRVTRIVDPTYSINYEYDANGNRRRIQTTYSNGLSGGKPPLDYWYEYDAMNRFTRVQGSMTPGFGISEGTEITYDLAGRRNTAMYLSNDKLVQECYTYTDGLLTTTTIFNWDAAGSPSSPEHGSQVRRCWQCHRLPGANSGRRHPKNRRTYTGDHAVKTETGPNGTSTSFL
jgi:YD repeat-containing protein